MNYITLQELKANLRLTNFTTDDSLLTSWISKSSRLIDNWKDRRFDIYKDTALLDCPKVEPQLGVFGSYSQQVFAAQTELFLNTSKLDLVDVISITNGDGIVVDLDDCVITRAHGFITKIYLKRSSGVDWLFKDGEWRNAIEVEGYFGSNSFYPECFVGSGETLAAQLTSEATSFVASDINGIADDLITPRFQAGQMLRLNSNAGIEFVIIKSIATNTVTLVRGVNGTTALTHPIATPIENFRVDETVTQMCIRLVQWRYRQKDTDSFDRTFNLAMQTATTPSALPADVRLILGRKGRFSI